MSTLNLSDNLIRLRKEKGVTQEEVAEFIGVTKASVSKWETKQSFPDIILLPQLASYYGVTVDELLGYEPQLGREQIRKIYRELAEEFAKAPFHEVMKKSEGLVKKYYTCYPFLFQICTLWLNHANLAGDQESQMEILYKASDLCSHIISGCRDMGICSDAVFLQAILFLLAGKPQETIDAVEDIMNPYRLARQSEELLIRAYQMTGQMEKAESYAQISMFSHLLALVGDAAQYLEIHAENENVCQETIARIDRLMEIYEFEKLHENQAAIFTYQAAVVKAVQKKPEEALKRLEKYVKIIKSLMDGDLKLHGDTYFNRIDGWFGELDLGEQALRDRKLVLASAMQAFDNPAFAELAENKIFVRLKEELQRGES